MAWAKIDDGFHDHPKLIGLPLDAVGLWTLALTWAHRHQGASSGVMGHIPADLPLRLGGAKGKKLAQQLEQHRLWDAEPDLGGWVIHDYLDYLPKSEQPKTASEVRKARSDAGKRGAQARWGDGKLPSACHEDDGNAMRSSHSKPMPPSRPVPTSTQLQVKTTTSLVKPSDIQTAFDVFWQVFPKKVAKQAAQRRFETLVKRGTDPADIIAGARTYRESRHGEDPQFTKQPDGWLNAGRWQDEPEPRNNHLATTDRRASDALALSERLKAAGE